MVLPYRSSFAELFMVANTSSKSKNMAAIEVHNALPTIQTSVGEFYNGKTVFITGGTGFMGKVLLEKLLRSCHGVAKIYLLIRPKKGQNSRERLQQLLCSPVSASKKQPRVILFFFLFIFFFYSSSTVYEGTDRTISTRCDRLRAT